MAVVRRIGGGATPLATAWTDATRVDGPDGATVARELGAPDAAIPWLDDPARYLGPRVDHGVLHFGLVSSEGSAAAERDVHVTLVVVWDKCTATVHEAADSLVDDAAARLDTESDAGGGVAAVLALVDELVERYERRVERLGREHEDHAVAVVGRSSSVQSSEEVVADGLRLARDIGDAQRDVRRVDAVLHALQLFFATTDHAEAVAAAVDARLPSVTALHSDLDGLDRHLEMTTNARISLISARQTEINKAIGAWGGVFAVNAVITGWYGMNIDNLPGSGSWVTAGSVMVVVTAILIIVFRRIDWL